MSGYTVIEAPAGEEAPGGVRTILPGPEPVLGFQFRGRILSVEGPGSRLLETCGITAIQSEPRRYRDLPGTGTLLIRFHPWGPAAFLPAPMHELAGRSVGLNLLLPPARVREAEEQLGESEGDAGRVRAAETFLLSLRRVRVPDGAVRRAVRMLQAGRGPETPGGPATPGRIAADLGLGERQLERKFREWVGVGPKRFARLARFRRLLQRIGSPQGCPQRLAAAALEEGFHDQAYFIKDFRALAGTTPEAFLREHVGFLQ